MKLDPIIIYIQKRQNRESFLFGTYVAFIFLLLIAININYMINNIQLVYYESYFLILLLASFFYYIYSKKIDFSIKSIAILISLISYMLLIEVGFRLALFHVIVPLYFFFLFSFKRAILYTILHQFIVVMIYLYGYITTTGLRDILYPGNILSLTIASLVIIAFGVIYHLTVKKYNTKLEIANYKNEILLSEIHHRVKNNLQMISNMLGLQQIDSSDQKLVEILEKTRFRIHSIATVHEILYRYDSFDEILFYDYITKLTDVIIDINGSNAKIYVENNSNVLSSEDILKLGIITNELLINSIKHAFVDIDGKVEISLKKEDDYLIYRYRDNGIKEVKLNTYDSLGYKIISLMVEQLSSKLILSTKKGIIFQLKIPLI